jgi:phage-related protein
MSYIIYNGINLQTFGVLVSGEGTYNAPSRAVTEQVVPGRNGTLLIDGGRFDNIEVTYPVFIPDMSNLDRLRESLLPVAGYVRLEDSYHPDEFRLASFSDGINVSTSGRYNTEGQFDLSFNCKPQRFLKSGETVTTLTADGEIENPTPYPSKPLIRIYGTGTVGVGDVNITFDGSSEYVDLDCDIMDAFFGATNKNSAVTLTPNRFPTLTGITGITVGSGITQVDIQPRWYRI